MLYFLDSRNIASQQGVQLKLGKVTKSPRNPFFGEDRDWESTIDNGYANVLHDKSDGLFKLWYTPFCDRAVHNAQVLCYAQSHDGLEWGKPEMGLFEWRGSTRNNILLPFISGAGIAYDEHATREDERFKMTYLVHPELAPGWAKELEAQGYPLPRRGGGVGFSADGIHWRLPQNNPVLPGIAGDTHNNWVYDEAQQKYFWITRANVPFEDGREGAERVVKRWESDDFMSWSNGTIVFRADGDEVGVRQYYSMPTFRYGNGWLGLLSLFNFEEDMVDVELAWSEDLFTWQRLCRGESFIPRGQKGEYDAGCIYAGYSPLVVGDDLRIYYYGSVNTHGAGINRQSTFNLAVLPRDRFAGLYAQQDGEITTGEVQCTGSQLMLNTDAGQGQLRVQLQWPDGSSIEGFSFDQCIPVTINSLDTRVTWKGQQSLHTLENRKLCVAIRLSNATVFGLRFS